MSNLARRQRAHEVEVAVVTLNRNFQSGELLPAREQWQGIDVVRVPYWGSTRYPLAPAVLRHLRSSDILHVHAIDFFVDYLAALKRVRLFLKPMVVSTHGGIFHTDQQLALKRLFFHSASRLSLKMFDRVVCCSVGDVDTFAQISDNLTLIENGIVIRKFGDAEAGVDGAALLYVGRLSSNKNLTALMAGVDAANAAGIEQSLIVVGRSNSGDIESLWSSHRQLRHPERVLLLIDADDATIRRSIRRSRYVVSASRYEGFGLTVPELMSYGLVPVLNDIPPFRRFVECSASGLLFDVERQPLAQAIAALPRGETWRGQSARARAYAETLSWEIVQQRFGALYDALLA